MCGINGIVYSERDGRSVDRDLLMRMRDIAEHRGPDDAGIFIDQNAGLGHRRLSIVDISSGGQPMHDNSGRRVIVYNGEVYNHADHRSDLIERGHQYKTHSDTEAILHLFNEYGADCLEKLRGMFAFAIWDKDKRELFVARDRFGVKPFYYVHKDDGSFYFASEIKSLIAAGAVRPELNYAALPDQFANHGTSGDETLFAGVKRLLPGHYLRLKNGRLEIRKYWDLEFEPKRDVSDDETAVAEWLELFRESVRLRLMSDVPLGMFLSGGIDSSAIAAVMAEMVSEPIKTFSVGFEDHGANEFEYARTVSCKFSTDHHEIVITPDEFFAKLPDLVWHEDEPLGFEASVPLFFVSKLAQKHVKVVLTGEGSDEMLGGYGRYRKSGMLLEYGRRYEAVTPSIVRNAVRSGVAVLPHAVNRKLKRTFLSRKADMENIYFDNFSIFGSAMQEKLFSAKAKGRIGESSPFAHMLEWLEKTDAVNSLDKMLYVDSKTYLHELLMKQDQMSMAASIESRVPFLDHKLAEFSAHLPERMKIRGGETKWILRRAMGGILPKEILERPKMGFPVPFGKWIRGSYRHIAEDLILSSRTLERGIFDPAVLRRLMDEHLAGKDHASRLFRLMNFEIWQRRFIDGEGNR